MRTLKLLVTLALFPALLAGQDQAVDRLGTGQETALARLAQVLPADVAEQVKQIVLDATSRGLPGQWIAQRALEGVAKGRSGAEVRAAAEALATELTTVREAFRQSSRTPDASELEAGATAMSLGVDGKTIAEFARNADRTRPTAVALAVLGALADAQIPVSTAYEAVLKRFNAGENTAQLVAMPGEAGRLLAGGMRPAEVGLALASQMAGRTLPAGPPANVPQNGGRPGERPQIPVQPPVPIP